MNKKGVNHHQDARESDFDKPVVSGISWIMGVHVFK
jgi:hypothetical protein